MVLGAGCLPAGSTVSGSALIHPKFPYAVEYDDMGKKSVLGDDWRLENYRKASEEPGKPTEIERKTGYDATYELDFNDDDAVDAKEQLPYPDLLFLHRKTNARLEIATVLLDDRLRDKELRVLLDDIVESQSGTRSLFVGVGKVAAGIQKRFASRLLESGEATLDGHQGLVATFERADIDQLQLNPDARWRRSRLFLMHAPFDHYVSDQPPGNDAIDAAPNISKGFAKFHKYAVLLAVEYTNTPEDFEAQYPDFVRLLNKTHMLTDAGLLAYLRGPLEHCAQAATSAKLNVSISERGAASVKDSEGLDSMCASAVIAPYAFPATGETRVASTQYDFSKPQEPGWLPPGGYVEHRQVAPSSTPKPEASPNPAGPESDVPVAPSAAPPSAAPSAPPEPPSPAPTSTQ
jgi:hypothetical protein